MNDANRPEPEVIHRPEQNRFETLVNGHVAYMSYTPAGNRMYFNHTYVPDLLRGQGVAGAVVRLALETAQTKGWKVVPTCSYVASFIERHPEFAGLVDPQA
jgi:predicted GNAT family acetyltransferase